MIDFETANETNSETSQGAGQKTVEDEVNELIDLMTRNEATTLNEQMQELEKLEMEKKLKNSAQAKNQPAKKPESSSSSFASKFSLDGLGLLSKPSASSAGELEPTSNASANLQAFKDLFTNANDEFEREWQSAFASNETSGTVAGASAADANLSPSQTEFGFFTSAAAGSEPSLFATHDLLKPLSPESLTSSKPAAATAAEASQPPPANKQSTTSKVSPH